MTEENRENHLCKELTCSQKNQLNWQTSSKTTKKKKKKEYKKQGTNIKNATDTITKDPADIKRIARKYNEHLYAHKFGNLNETDQFHKIQITTTHPI